VPQERELAAEGMDKALAVLLYQCQSLHAEARERRRDCLGPCVRIFQRGFFDEKNCMIIAEILSLEYVWCDHHRSGQTRNLIRCKVASVTISFAC
jgi:hypothetical protein